MILYKLNMRMNTEKTKQSKFKEEINDKIGKVGRIYLGL